MRGCQRDENHEPIFVEAAGCTLLQSYMDAIAKDRGQHDVDRCEHGRADMLADMDDNDAFWKRGANVGMCRFFGPRLAGHPVRLLATRPAEKERTSAINFFSHHDAAN